MCFARKSDWTRPLDTFEVGSWTRAWSTEATERHGWESAESVPTSLFFSIRDGMRWIGPGAFGVLGQFYILKFFRVMNGWFWQRSRFVLSSSVLTGRVNRMIHRSNWLRLRALPTENAAEMRFWKIERPQRALPSCWSVQLQVEWAVYHGPVLKWLVLVRFCFSSFLHPWSKLALNQEFAGIQLPKLQKPYFADIIVLFCILFEFTYQPSPTSNFRRLFFHLAILQLETHVIEKK